MQKGEEVKQRNETWPLRRAMAFLLALSVLNSSILSCGVGTKRDAVSTVFDDDDSDNGSDDGSDSDRGTDSGTDDDSSDFGGYREVRTSVEAGVTSFDFMDDFDLSREGFNENVEGNGGINRWKRDGDSYSVSESSSGGSQDKARIVSSNGDKAALKSDDSAASETGGLSDTASDKQVREALENALSGKSQEGGVAGLDKALGAIIDQLGLGGTNPEQGLLAGLNHDICDGCEGRTASGGVGASSGKTSLKYADLDSLEGAVREQRSRLLGNLASAGTGASQARERISAAAGRLIEQHNAVTESLQKSFADTGLVGIRPSRFITDPKARLGQEIRDVAGRLNRDANPRLSDIQGKLLKQADQLAYSGNINAAGAFLVGAEKIADLSQNPAQLPAETFDAAVKANYGPGRFDEKDERIKAGRAALDLYDAASALRKDHGAAASQALANAGVLLDVALGLARFSALVDAPLSAMEFVTGKTVTFDETGAPRIVEASAFTRAAAGLTLGIAAAAVITTGPVAGAAIAAAAAVVPKLAHSIKKISEGLSRTERAVETLSGIEKTVDRLIDTGKQIGFKSADEIAQHSAIIERWGDAAKVTKIEDAAAINKSYGEPPYLAGSKVVEMETTATETFVRVHGPNFAAGNWVMRENDIVGLTGPQIAAKFNIPEVPTALSKVSVPGGVKMRTGIVGPNAFGSSKGAIQFEILMPNGEFVPADWFTKMRDL